MFTTGTNAGGYTLTSIELDFWRIGGTAGLPSVTLHTVTVGGTSVTLGAAVATLTTSDPNILFAMAETYTAPPDTALNSSTTYGVVVKGGGPGTGYWALVADGNEVGTPAPGWSIGDLVATRPHDGSGGLTYSFSTIGPGEIRVTGTAKASTNNPPTGKPGITGTAQVGQVLTATVGTIADVDGLPDPFFSDAATTIAWIQVATDNTETNIAGATASTYTLVAADLGTTVKVRVSFTDDASNAETLTSAATAAVSAAPNTPATGAPTITGTAQVGQTLTAGTTAIMDADGLTSVSYTYQWIRVATGTRETNISGATASTYTLVAADQGTTIKVRVSFTDDASNAETLTSAATAAVSAAPMTPAHCNPSDPLELWCATLTVGFDPIAGAIYGYFDPLNYSGTPGRKGSLSQLQFTYKGVTYTLDDLSIDASSSGTENRGLFFGLSGLGETVFSNDARFTLRLGTMDVSLGDSGWEIDGMTMPRTGLSWANGDTVQVTLTRSNAAPTAADNTLTTTGDTQSTFDAGDFNFSDTADRDDTLESVKITTLPTAGTLSVDGTAIASGDLPKAVSKADIDADKLTYIPASNANGSATFRFKVNDGYDDSALDYLMTVSATEVPATWSLIPTGLTAGDQFRLLFLSSTKRNASSTDIADYNTFIQGRAAAGHADIRAYSTGFRAVGCTADTDARDNTETTYTGTAKGVPIYWLNGAKAADQYEDFYDGSWDDEANDKNESGTNGPDTSQVSNYPSPAATTTAPRGSTLTTYLWGSARPLVPPSAVPTPPLANTAPSTATPARQPA